MHYHKGRYFTMVTETCLVMTTWVWHLSLSRVAKVSFQMSIFYVYLLQSESRPPSSPGRLSMGRSNTLPAKCSRCWTENLSQNKAKWKEIAATGELPYVWVTQPIIHPSTRLSTHSSIHSSIHPITCLLALISSCLQAYLPFMSPYLPTYLPIHTYTYLYHPT